MKVQDDAEALNILQQLQEQGITLRQFKMLRADVKRNLCREGEITMRKFSHVFSFYFRGSVFI